MENLYGVYRLEWNERTKRAEKVLEKVSEAPTSVFRDGVGVEMVTKISADGKEEILAQSHWSGDEGFECLGSPILSQEDGNRFRPGYKGMLLTEAGRKDVALASAAALAKIDSSISVAVADALSELRGISRFRERRDALRDALLANPNDGLHSPGLNRGKSSP